VTAGHRQQRFEQVYSDNRGAILGYVLRRTSNADDAADVIADTFLTAWRRLDDIPPGGAARPWLYGVARRALANHHRGERRRTALGERLRSELTASAFGGPGGEDSAAQPVPEDVAAAFRGLPERDREILSLAGWEGLDAGQIALVLACSRNAARIRLHRARRRFALALRETGAVASDMAGQSA
jgi:RNA polymerase sigma-70 factor (ECF subfamily)